MTKRDKLMVRYLFHQFPLVDWFNKQKRWILRLRMQVEESFKRSENTIVREKPPEQKTNNNNRNNIKQKMFNNINTILSYNLSSTCWGLGIL